MKSVERMKFILRYEKLEVDKISPYERMLNGSSLIGRHA